MKYIIALLMALSIPAHAEIQPFETALPIMCGDSKNLLRGLRDRYNEELVFITESETVEGDLLSHSLWINAKTSTWSFIATNKEKGVTCVISSGDTFSLMYPQGI